MVFLVKWILCIIFHNNENSTLLYSDYNLSKQQVEEKSISGDIFLKL